MTSQRSPAQLARKRQQDRDAQRLARERTRETLAELRARVAEQDTLIATQREELQASEAARLLAEENLQHIGSQVEQVQIALDTVRRYVVVSTPALSTSMLVTAGSHQATTDLEDRTVNSLDSTVGTDKFQMGSYLATPESVEVASFHYAGRVALSSPTCPLDQVLLRFMSSRSDLLSDVEAIGSSEPNLASLLLHTSSWPMHPISRACGDIVTRFDSVSMLPEQVAVHWVFFHLLRWHIRPSEENLFKIPEWLRPLPCQLEHLHPPWMDFVPWPKMREALVTNPAKFNQDDFFLPYTQTLSINWPYNRLNCIVADVTSGVVRISSVFEQHVKCLDNWSLGLKFMSSYPTLSTSCRIVDR